MSEHHKYRVKGSDPNIEVSIPAGLLRPRLKLGFQSLEDGLQVTLQTHLPLFDALSVGLRVTGDTVGADHSKKHEVHTGSNGKNIVHEDSHANALAAVRSLERTDPEIGNLTLAIGESMVLGWDKAGLFSSEEAIGLMTCKAEHFKPDEIRGFLALLVPVRVTPLVPGIIVDSQPVIARHLIEDR